MPTHITSNQLTSLTELQPLAVQHYSGTLAYKTTFNIDEAILGDNQGLQLDLSEVGVIARVNLNVNNLVELWSRPLSNRAIEERQKSIVIRRKSLQILASACK